MPSHGLKIPPRWTPDLLRGFRKLVSRGDREALEWIRDLAADKASLDWGAHLHNAVRAGSLPIVRDLLSRGLASASASGPKALDATPREIAEPSSLSPSSFESWPCAFEAIHSGKTEILRELCRFGFGIRSRHYSSSGIGSAFHAWADSSRLEADSRASLAMAELLLELGCDASMLGSGASSRLQPISAALLSSRTGQAETLLLLGAHRPRAKALSPLPSCVALGRRDLLEMLLDLGEPPDGLGLLPASGSVWRSSYPSSLSRIPDPSLARCALFEAALRKDEASCELLIARGASPGMPAPPFAWSSHGQPETILEWDARRGSLSFLQSAHERQALLGQARAGQAAAKARLKKERRALRAQGIEEAPAPPPSPRPRRSL